MKDTITFYRVAVCYKVGEQSTIKYAVDYGVTEYPHHATRWSSSAAARLILDARLKRNAGFHVGAISFTGWIERVTETVERLD